ncbi:hypothetical protein ACFQZ4_38285 [Catellatospora coxensis]
MDGRPAPVTGPARTGERAQPLPTCAELAVRRCGERAVRQGGGGVRLASARRACPAAAHARHAHEWKASVTMRKLSPQDLDRLVRSHRNLKISVWVFCFAMIGVLALLIANNLMISPACGTAVGVGIGALLLIPQKQLLAELGLSRQEAKQILRDERKRRKSAAA